MTSVDDTSAAVSNGCHVSFSVNFSRSERVSDGRARFFQPALKLPYYSMLGSVWAGAVDYLLYTLNTFGFGPNFISWIQFLSSSPMRHVLQQIRYCLLMSHFSVVRDQDVPYRVFFLRYQLNRWWLNCELTVALRASSELTRSTKSFNADDLLMSEPLCSLPRALARLECFESTEIFRDGPVYRCH